MTHRASKIKAAAGFFDLPHNDAISAMAQLINAVGFE